MMDKKLTKDLASKLKCKDGVLIIPDGVEVIDKRAFQIRFDIKKIIIPDSVTYIGEYAFYSCTKLEEVVLPKRLNIIQEGTFCNCFNLKKVDNLQGVLYIAKIAFLNTALESIYLRFDTNFDTNSFYNKCNIIFVDYDGNVLKESEILTRNKAKKLRAKNKTVTIPARYKAIGKRAFANRVDFQQVIIEDGVISIGKSAFSGCKNLRNIQLPLSLKYIGMKAFLNTALNNVNLPYNINVISKSAFANCKKLSSVILPKHLSKIHENTFCNCKSLKDIHIPRSIEKISKGAFVGTKVRYVNIACNTNIEDGAFDKKCKVMKESRPIDFQSGKYI